MTATVIEGRPTALRAVRPSEQPDPAALAGDLDAMDVALDAGWLS